MNNVTNLVRKYRQAPWRVQLQWIGLFSLGLVLVASVAAVYLSISTRTAVFGREIQQMDSDMEEVERNIANLNNQLAMLTAWLDRLPGEILETHPWMCVYRAYGFYWGGKRDLEYRRHRK